MDIVPRAMHQHYIKYALLIFIFVNMILTAAAAAQSDYQYYNPNDERYKFLALKKAEINLRELKKKYDSQKALYERHLISEEDFNAVSRSYGLAQVEFQQAMLAVIFEKPHITVKSAVKYLTDDGRKRVKLVLVNTTGGSLDMGKLDLLDPMADDTSYIDKLDFNKLTNVYVSLKDEGSIISQPYEYKIEEMDYNKPVTIDFGLLKDLESVVVSFSYGDKIDEKQITLMKDSHATPISINSIQFSQEADLGGTARYDLALEQFASGSATYKMMVVNLPEQITYEFHDAASNLRVSQVKFTEGITTQKLNLVLFLPDRAAENIPIDTPITFYALALDEREAARVSNRDVDHFDAHDVADLSGGSVKLELIPRGVGKIELVLPQLYFSIGSGDTVVSDIIVKNEGTVTLFNIRPLISLPYDWVGTVTPETVDKLNPGGEERLQARCFPSHDVGVGDYEISVSAESFANNKRIEVEPKTVRVHMSSTASLLGSLAIIVGIVGAVVVAIIIGLKISRR